MGAIQMAEPMKIILLLLIWCFTEARSSSDQFMTINDCTCEGDTLTYECTVFGGVATVWKGTSFDCSATNNEVVMFHSINFTSQGAKVCNDGAITGRVILVENGTYTSQLTVQVSTEINGSTIYCAHDNGIDTPVIGSTLLTLITVPYPPPNDVKLVEANNTHLSFNWSQVAMSCPSIRYHIVASNCGHCPNTTTNTIVTCSGNYIKLLKDQQCSFAVQTVVCDGIAGDVSTAVNITIRSLDLNPVMADGGATASSSIVITFGAVIGAMFIVIVFITSIFTAITVILVRSKRALHIELEFLKSKMKEQPVIYEEIARLQDSLKSSSPPINTGENTAYVSAFVANACKRFSM